MILPKVPLHMQHRSNRHVQKNRPTLRREARFIELLNAMNEYEMKLVDHDLFCRETVGQYDEKPQNQYYGSFSVITETRDSVQKVLQI